MNIQLNLFPQPVIIPTILRMEFEYKTLSTADLLDIITKNTMRYNQILLTGGPIDEFDMLREAIKLLQREIEKRKEEGQE